MKKLMLIFSFFLVLPFVFNFVSAECVSIGSGLLKDSNGNTIVQGYDQYGYNYQSHIFNGFADNYSRPSVPVTSGDKLIMKWSDSWLANVDCDGDEKLDRGLVDGEQTGEISRGWLTNHFIGDTNKYTDFIKIVWVGPGGTLWGQYKIIQEVWNDKSLEINGIYDKIKAPGFGLNEGWTIIP